MMRAAGRLAHRMNTQRQSLCCLAYTHTNAYTQFFTLIPFVVRLPFQLEQKGKKQNFILVCAVCVEEGALGWMRGKENATFFRVILISIYKTGACCLKIALILCWCKCMFCRSHFFACVPHAVAKICGAEKCTAQQHIAEFHHTASEQSTLSSANQKMQQQQK